MNKKAKKLSLILTSVIIASSIIGGCKAPSKDAKEGNPITSVGESYPLKTDVTLTYWMLFPSTLSTYYTNYGETPIAKALQEKTGIKVKFVHPTIGNEKEQFNLLIASNELPDIIEWNWENGYSGGPEKSFADKVIIPLNAQIQKNAPHLKKFLSENKDVDRDMKTDNNNYYGFPQLRSTISRVSSGMQIRKDWLDDLKLEIPTTIEDWYNVLRAFKKDKNAIAPYYAPYASISGEQGGFSGAFKTTNTYYIKDGTVYYGPIDPQYKDYIITMKKWYAEGLIDKDFPTADSKKFEANMTTNKSGATYAFVIGGMGKLQDVMKDKDPKFTLVGVPHPTLKKGEIPMFGQKDRAFHGATIPAITTQCKHPEIAVKFLDYAYSKEGHIVNNFGIEGESYTMVNGEPKFTDNIYKNPKGLTTAQALVNYTRFNGPFVSDATAFIQRMTYPQQKAAMETWAKTEAEKYACYGSPTSEESAEFAKINNDVESYRNEMFIKFVMGSEPIENFDKYVQRIKDMKIERAIKIRQDAMDRYLKR